MYFSGIFLTQNCRMLSRRRKKVELKRKTGDSRGMQELGERNKVGCRRKESERRRGKEEW